MSDVTDIKGLSLRAAFFLGEKVAAVRNPTIHSTQSDFRGENGASDFLENLSWRPELLSRIQKFAHRPQSWIHPSQVKFSEHQEAISLFSKLTTESGIDRWQRKTARRIDLDHKLPELDYQLFENVQWRFALISLDLLKQLVRQAGLFNLSSSISALTSEDDLNSTVKQLGQGTFESTLNLSPVIQGVAFQATARVPKNWTNDVTEAADLMGWFTLGSVFSEAPKSIVKRFELKLPKEVCEVVRTGRKKPMETPDRVAEFLIRILKNNVDRKEAICIF